MSTKHHVKVRSLNAAGTFAGGAFWPARADVDASVDDALLGCLRAHPHLAVTDVEPEPAPVEASAEAAMNDVATVTPVRRRR